MITNILEHKTGEMSLYLTQVELGCDLCLLSDQGWLAVVLHIRSRLTLIRHDASSIVRSTFSGKKGEKFGIESRFSKLIIEGELV